SLGACSAVDPLVQAPHQFIRQHIELLLGGLRAPVPTTSPTP
ncbi:MAG: hypothetical protein RJB37_1655, partial [Pseudomonadota bacterium]